MELKELGKTGVMVPEIGLGTWKYHGGDEPLRRGIELGACLIDAAEGYRNEEAVGHAIKGLRDRVFLATKFCTPRGHLGPGASVQEYMEAVNGSLGRLQTDHVALVHVHSCNSVDRLMDENAHEAFDRLKDQGKVRFLGVSTHTPNLEEVANAAIESNRFDVMMLAYHHGAWPELGSLIERAAAADIGVVAMKTLKGRSRGRRTMWSRRAQEYEAKINSGDPVLIAEVVRDLHRKEDQPDQSYSERQIYQGAFERLMRELAAVEEIDEDAATEQLQTVLKAD